MYGQGNQKGPKGFLQKNTVIVKAKLAVGEEWATRTVEIMSPVGDPRPLPLELLAGLLRKCNISPSPTLPHSQVAMLTVDTLCGSLLLILSMV